jgi:hypothetical protein
LEVCFIILYNSFLLLLLLLKFSSFIYLLFLFYLFFFNHHHSSARCGSYDPSKRADPLVQARLIQWLQARQTGVNNGRKTWCENEKYTALLENRLPLVQDCNDGNAIHTAAGVTVYHGSEVNLVLASMNKTNPFPNNILEVIPYVSLDVVTYSSYDTMNLNATFGDALDFIAQYHNRTSVSPTPAIIVAEYGIAQMEDPNVNHLLHTYSNVNAWAYSIGPTGKRRAMATFAWELFDNEVDVSTQYPGGRCNAQVCFFFFFFFELCVVVCVCVCMCRLCVSRCLLLQI